MLYTWTKITKMLAKDGVYDDSCNALLLDSIVNSL